VLPSPEDAKLISPGRTLSQAASPRTSSIGSPALTINTNGIVTSGVTNMKSRTGSYATPWK
jgi:hypothetical protein